MQNEIINKIKKYYSKFDINNSETIYQAFEKATDLRYYNKNIIELMLDLDLDTNIKDKMIHIDRDAAFKGAAYYGHLDILNKIIDFVSDDQLLMQMIKDQRRGWRGGLYSPDYTVYRYSAENGQLHIVERLIEVILKIADFQELENMLLGVSFNHIAGNGHLNIIDKVLSIVHDPQKREKLIHSHHDEPFAWASGDNHLSVMERLIELTPDKERRLSMIRKRKDEAFLRASSIGWLFSMIRIAAEIDNTKEVAELCKKHKYGCKSYSGKPKQIYYNSREYLEYPAIMIKLGKIYLDLYKYGFSSAQITEIPEVVKSLIPVIKSCKDIDFNNIFPVEIWITILSYIPINVRDRSGKTLKYQTKLHHLDFTQINDIFEILMAAEIDQNEDINNNIEIENFDKTHSLNTTNNEIKEQLSKTNLTEKTPIYQTSRPKQELKFVERLLQQRTINTGKKYISILDH